MEPVSFLNQWQGFEHGKMLIRVAKRRCLRERTVGGARFPRRPLEGLLFDRMKEGRGGSRCTVVAGAVSGTERSQLICLEQERKGAESKGGRGAGSWVQIPPVDRSVVA